jgi:hypothetical protein
MLINATKDALALIQRRPVESDMKNRRRVGCIVMGILVLGFPSATGHAAEPAISSITYECAASAKCNVVCSVDGEKQVQTGSPKTVIITPIATNNYLVELVEQNGHVQTSYLAGAKFICNFDGLTKKDGG